MFFTLRKLIFIFFIFLNFFLVKDSVFALGTTKTIQKSYLKAHYTFDDNDISVTNVYDKSGNRNNGTSVNSPASSFGRLGQSFLFNGSSSYVSIPNSSSLNFGSGDISVSFWVNSASTTDIHGLMRKGNAFNTNSTGWEIRLRSNSTQIEACVNGGLGTCPKVVASISSGWNHVVFVVSRTNASSSLYINGIYQTSMAHAPTYTDNQTLYLGAGFDAFYSGHLDDLRVYNKKLTDNEIVNIYKNSSISVKNSDNTNIAGYWPLNENYSNDYGGKGNNLTVNGTCLSTSSDSVSGKVSITGWATCGTAPQLSGYLSSGDVLNSSSEFTFVAWYKGGGIIWSGAPTFWLNVGSGAYLDKYTGSWVNVAGYGGSPCNTSSWCQVVVTKNSAGGIKIYLNTAEVGSSTTQTFYTPTSHTIGRYAVYDDGGYHFVGKIDDVRMYSRILSVSEIKELYKIKPAVANTSKIKVDNSLSGPILHYTFDGPRLNSSTSTDSGSTGANGTLVGTLRSAVGRIGQSLNFDGTSGYISVGSNMANNDMTIATWIKPRTTAGYIATEGVINSGIRYYLNFNSNKINWSCYNGGYYTAASNNDIQTDKWTHVVGTIKSGETGGLKLYINGVLQSSSSTIAACGSYGTLYIGSYIWPISNYFNGLMDDFRVYNRSLSQAEITKLYQLGGR